MNYLMIGIIVLSIVVLIMGFFLLYYQVVIVNSMKNDFRRIRKELMEELSFESYNWSDSFRSMRRDIKSDKEHIAEINSLQIIKKAKEVKRLEELERTKANAEREIDKLNKNGW
ncbi:hypothetical protein [Streptococcus uberis]|uniref:hypothetical protein n=1 Tax=Streptococcus uberis TaxID=1349 RepID=UPI00193A972D|nr:hypothetical protein [Streptococcus uberis]